MTREEKLVMLGYMMGGQDIIPEVLELYFDLAGQNVLNRMYPYKTDYTGMDVPDRYLNVQLNVAVYLLNKRGAEGEIQHIENGIHRNYGSADVPDGMLKDVVPFCQAIR